MSEEEAFLAAIYATPDDDAPRLVFADWLEENGQEERAEFIRLQCKEARESLNYEEDNRMFDLEGRFEKVWTEHLPQNDRYIWQWDFRRGFPEELAIEIHELLEHYEQWVSWPRVRYLTLYETMTFHLSEFVIRHWNPNWISLMICKARPSPWDYGHTDDPDVGLTAVIMNSQAAQLRELRLSRYSPGMRTINALCESPYLSELKVLEVELPYSTEPRLVARFGAALRTFD